MRDANAGSASRELIAGGIGKWLLLLFPLGLLSASVAFSAQGLGDYPVDAGPAIDALRASDLAGFLSAHPDMGPVSIVVRAPFAALGGDELWAYRWGALPCVIAAGLLGLYLARLAGRRGAGTPAQAALVGVCVVNPLNVAAVESGHPEEILTAVLAVGAVAAAAEGHRGRTAILLGLAIACKQWAVIAALPALMALPSRRIHTGLAAAAISLVLVLPNFLADPHSFLSTQRSLAVESQYVTPWSVWFPFTVPTTEFLPGVDAAASTYYASPLVARLSHPLIVVVALLVPLGLALRRRGARLSGTDAMAVLSLVALARCVLDPVDNLYYHTPLLLSLAGWDAFAGRGVPARALTGAVVLGALSYWDPAALGASQFNALYLAVAVAAALAIAFAVLRPGGRISARLRPQGALGPVRIGQMSGH
jgi:hypothetical protein